MKHVFLLRVCESENGYLLKDSRVYESENRELTIDDYLKIRSHIDDVCRLVCKLWIPSFKLSYHFFFCHNKNPSCDGLSIYHCGRFRRELRQSPV